MWKNAIPGANNFKKGNFICDLHFQKDDITTEYVTKMPDGSEFRLKRDLIRLKNGVVATIFPEEKIKESLITPEEFFLKETDFFFNSEKCG